MPTKKCLDCSEYKNCKDSFASWIFFIIGLIATIAIRVVTVLIHVDPIYAKIAWYIGIGGFLFFFIYKFNVSRARAATLRREHLLDKVNNQTPLAEGDYKVMGAILCGISSKKETINYFFIFGLSAVALLLAIYMDFIR